MYIFDQKQFLKHIKENKDVLHASRLISENEREDPFSTEEISKLYKPEERLIIKSSLINNPDKNNDDSEFIIT